jgi:hypothetical protein
MSAQGMSVPIMINLPQSPLHFISIKSTLTDFLHEVTVTNVSGKEIVNFQLGLIMTIPSACGPKEVIAPQQLMLPDDVDIEPGAQDTTTNYRYYLTDVARFMQQNHARGVITQLTVVQVDFADGTSWSLHRDSPVYDEHQWKQEASLCRADNQASAADHR